MLTEADTARKAHGEAARREAKEKAKAEGLRRVRALLVRCVALYAIAAVSIVKWLDLVGTAMRPS